jgi:hypothetical protein
MRGKPKLTLVTNDGPTEAGARSSDPPTSHAAAARTSQSKLEETCYRILCEHPTPMSGNDMTRALDRELGTNLGQVKVSGKATSVSARPIHLWRKGLIRIEGTHQRLSAYGEELTDQQCWVPVDRLVAWSRKPVRSCPVLPVPKMIAKDYCAKMGLLDVPPLALRCPGPGEPLLGTDALLRYRGAAVEDYARIAATKPILDQALDDFTRRNGPIGRALSMLIRPAFVAPKEKVLVWGDWSNIEARVNPWLADSPEGKAKLELFRRSDADPSAPDIYEMTAASLLGCPPGEVTDDQRQSHGKVPELSLGFGGGIGALLNMANTYNVYLSEETARQMVEAWRIANPWARRFWDQIWEAIQSAMAQPGAVFKAGRVAYYFMREYLGGSLFCVLPNGRLLTYPQAKFEWREVENKASGEVEQKWELTYRKGHGRPSLWYGKACENVVQATAGSLLRTKLVTLEDECGHWLTVVGHTHDDILCEVVETNADLAKATLAEIMTEAESWSAGLPLAVGTTAHWWFTKALG